MMSETRRRFVGNRDMLLTPKADQTARGLAEDLVPYAELGQLEQDKDAVFVQSV